MNSFYTSNKGTKQYCVTINYNIRKNYFCTNVQELGSYTCMVQGMEAGRGPRNECTWVLLPGSAPNTWKTLTRHKSFRIFTSKNWLPNKK